MVIYNMKKSSARFIHSSGKRVLLVFTILFLILITPFALSQEELTEEEKIDEAYECLEEKVEGRCASLSSEERIFSLLAINKCKAEVIGDSDDGECWPAGDCNLKTTAQAILALDNSNSDTTSEEDWLLSQNQTPTQLTWYLQIESSQATTCSISYSDSSHSVDIGEDKKISKPAGACLSLAQNDYWLRVSPVCYEEEIEISCDETFITTLLFKRNTSPTIHVSEEASSAAGGGTTTERVESFCFAEGGSCDYEGSLWAALVLNAVGRDVSSYLPYLVTLEDENRRFLPEAFLYFLTSKTEYRDGVLSKQKSDKWWMESGDKFYDTALVLYPFQQETLQEKIDAKAWLLDVQDSDSCWDGGNKRNTAFILASIWPRSFGGVSGEGGLPDCETSGGFCRLRAGCEDDGGDILGEYECPASFKCCNVQQTMETCLEMNGYICGSGEACTGTLIDSADGRCCIQGSCEPAGQDISECELNNGVCRYGCDPDEEEAFYACDISGNSCCVLKTTDEKSYWWVWVLLILIILVVIGIIFRDKLRGFWLRMQSRGKPRPRKDVFDRPRPGPTPPLISPRPVQRRILPPSRHPPLRRPRKAKTSKELEDVLKKLKDMGK
jgi:hypothetical protein